MAEEPSKTSVWRVRIVRYSIPIGAVSVAVMLRLFLESLFKGETTPFLLLFAAVLVSAGFAGLGPGLLATILGEMASDFFFIGPRFHFGPWDINNVSQLLLFIVEGVFISLLGAGLQAARRRAERSEAEARRLERKILDISDDERRRIGQDLHDGLGQHLTGVAFLSKALQERLASQSRPEAGDATKIAALVSESIGQTKALARGLAPVVLEEGGLTWALSQLASSTSSVFGIQCVYICKDRIELDDLTVATHLYRVAQEAINNAIRHGKATRVDVRLSARDGRLRLAIEDNGVGISPKTDAGGMGLQIMNFRARMISGSLTVGRRDGGGTSVVCTAPLRLTERETP